MIHLNLFPNDLRKEFRKSDPKKRQQVRRSALKSQLKGEFGLTLKDYRSMFDAQGGCCAICGKSGTRRGQGRPGRGGGRSKKLGVDHDHATGKVRGLLCRECNAGIGFLKDDITLVQTALDYLKRGR